ncbi:PadR family transcriptional regulator [Conexibacter stalactiti]|uniref:PadR family transcriptional regulator n=1 Tax=Conexibacter stalactiti TaxID=1940611 RepID=A0ABU4HI34_9ACTN|nr:PadR family transcriptional regulator [Conexibacter stalactiti]MEC5033615.1 PadR family transcriptional regulator [Conexibacter stalactiti]
MRAAVLASVIEEPGHAYGVGSAMTVRFGGVIGAKARHVYPVLRALADEGLVEATRPLPGTRSGGTAVGGWYRATAAGVERWREWLASPLDGARAAVDAKVRLLAARPDDLASAEGILDAYAEHLRQAASDLPELGENVSLQRRLTTDFDARLIDAQLDWISDARSRLRREAARRR